MAVVDPIFLSSSSTPRVAGSISLSASKNGTSSSPALPSPSQILMGQSSRFDRRGAAILPPKDVNSGFISVSSLLHASMTDEMMSPIRHAGLGRPAAKPVIPDPHPAARGGKTEVTKVRENGGQKKAKGIRQKSSRSESNPNSDLTSVHAMTNIDGDISAPDKKIVKTSRKSNQSQIQRTKIIKPGASTADLKRLKEKDVADAPEIPYVDSEDQTGGEKATETLHPQVIYNLGLPQASRRRKDWTPTKRTVGDADRLNDEETAWSLLSPCGSPSTGKCMDTGFGKLFEDFGYANMGKSSFNESYILHDPSGKDCTKRRKLDLVAGIAVTASNTKPKRTKSPKKKPRTITEKATAPFITEGVETTSIRSYLTAHEMDRDLHCSDRLPVMEEAIGKPETKQASDKKPTKATRKKAKISKTTKQPVKLLSPESAMKVTNEQDLLFGTSSQLAREESPAFMRNLQRAVRESEIAGEIESSLHGKESQVSAQSSTSNISSSTLPTGSRNLWAVAARDSANSLLQIDIVDLVDTPQPSRSLSTVPKTAELQGELELPSKIADNPVNEGWNVIEDVTNKESFISVANDPHSKGSPIPLSVAEASLKERPRSKSPAKKTRKRKESQIPAADILPPEIPNYNSLDTKELNKAAAAFGFKPMKRREELIPLLETCWRSKNRIALQSLPPNISATIGSSKNVEKEELDLGSAKKRRGRPPKVSSAESKETASPKKPRGRPKKNTATDELLHETSGAGPVPPSSLEPATAKVSRPLAVSTSTAVAAAARELEMLLPIITKAVITYPPTHDPNNLTWYEKMLLYDPIVLEDLADWLNREGLGRVSCTSEVSPVIVKQWCESQSVCCLWKENQRGGQRARH